MAGLGQNYRVRFSTGMAPVQEDEPSRRMSMQFAASNHDKPNRQMSAYFPSRGTQAQSPRTALFLKLALFAFFVLTRALHPLLIDFSKTDGKILYAKNTPVAMNKVLTVILMNLMALACGGVKGIRMCWQPQCLLVFGLIGTIYALGDFLEMLSMSSLSGGVYQVLLQTKLLITALMIWWLKGSKQTPLQWHVLFSMFLALSSFVLVDMGAAGDGAGASSLPLGGVACVLLKVAVSCYCAVLSEKYLKAYADLPLFAKISGLSTTWAMASMMLCLTEPQVAENGFFAHWDNVTWLVTASFVVKTVSTMYLLQALDSVQKNIGEALAVIVIYSAQVCMDKSFELSVFLLAILVVGLVKTYLISGPKKDAKPADQSAQRTTGLAKSKRVKLVSVNPSGTPLMASMGYETIRCETKEKLPDGVWYGMLGDVHAVCGNTNPNSKEQCELMLLSQPPTPGKPGKASGSAAPFMPNQTITVLGHIRGGLPRDQLAPDQFTRDAEAAREKFVDHYTI